MTNMVTIDGINANEKKPSPVMKGEEIRGKGEKGKREFRKDEKVEEEMKKSKKKTKKKKKESPISGLCIMPHSRLLCVGHEDGFARICY
mmetsp:Transcript_29557/g.54253  ORF Transcript_29557/g.54253 Transcript_29557/m.54253 type:complete len:89 (+) Transcript_29557:3-269(+)